MIAARPRSCARSVTSLFTLSGLALDLLKADARERQVRVDTGPIPVALTFDQLGGSGDFAVLPAVCRSIRFGAPSADSNQLTRKRSP